MEDQLESITEGPKEITLTDGRTITIRPFTLGAISLCKKLGLTMFTGEAEDTGDDADDGEGALDDSMVQQLQTFFWMQSTPVPELLKSVRDGSWELEVEEFGLFLPVHEMETLMSEVNRISAMAAAVSVDVEPQGSGTDNSGVPGN
mgnify:CR=1 FL=1